MNWTSRTGRTHRSARLSASIARDASAIYRRPVPDLDRHRIVAFRVASHNLAERLGPRSLVKAAAACGIQETPLGSAALGLCARVEGLTPAALDGALLRRRTLIHLWSLRGAPYLIPSRDLDVFTAGALPFDRGSFDVFLGGWAGAIEEAGLEPSELLGAMATATRTLLDGRTRDVNELRDALLQSEPSLSKIKRPSGARHDMPEPLYRAIGLAGAACIVGGRGTDAVLARLDRWLEKEPPSPDPRVARAELVRRFLHCYGPSTPQRFAEWTARSPRDAKAAFELVAGELVEVHVARGRAWLLSADEKAIESPPRSSGARLLPVQDPFLQQRDRTVLVEDEWARRRLWRPVRGPGAVLVDGEIAGAWQARKAGSRLQVSVEPFRRLAVHVRAQIEEEAERLAPFRGLDSTEVEFQEGR
jgi:hypothetical protein